MEAAAEQNAEITSPMAEGPRLYVTFLENNPDTGFRSYYHFPLAGNEEAINEMKEDLEKDFVYFLHADEPKTEAEVDALVKFCQTDSVSNEKIDGRLRYREVVDEHIIEQAVGNAIMQLCRPKIPDDIFVPVCDVCRKDRYPCCKPVESSDGSEELFIPMVVKERASIFIRLAGNEEDLEQLAADIKRFGLEYVLEVNLNDKVTLTPSDGVILIGRLYYKRVVARMMIQQAKKKNNDAFSHYIFPYFFRESADE